MAAAELPAFDQPAPSATPAPMRGPAMGPVAQLEADREYSTEELDLLEKSSTPPPPQEFTTDELDQEAVRLFDDPTYAPTRDEYFDLKATKERLKAEGKLPGTAELAAKAVGGLFVTAIDAVNSTIFSPAETLAKSPATLQTGIGRAALGAMQLGGWAAEAMQGAPKYRDEDTGEFFHFTDPDSRQLQLALDAGRKLRPTTDEDLKDYEFENYIFKKGIDAEYQALGEKTAPTELLTRLITGRNQQETPNISQAGALEIVADPTNLIPFGAGAKTLGLSRLGKTVSAQTAGVIGKVAGGVADAGDAMANRFTDVVTNATGLSPSAAGNAVKFISRTSVGGGLAAGAATLGAPPEVTATIAGFYPAYKAGIGVLRKIETGAGAAKIILRESADATNGLDQAARAAVLANPSVPQVFKEVLERPTNFIPIESTPARLAAEQSLSPQMRSLMGKLSNPAIVQSVRGASALAKGAVKGAAINAPFALLAANAGDDEEAAAMLGAGAAFGAAGAGVDRFTGLQQRRQQAAISDVSRMLVDVELSGGDVGKLMSTQTPESLVKLASLQGTFRNGLEFIPLNATDYNANVAANGGAGSAGLFVQAPAGERAKVYINLDAKRQGIEPHEFGHALLASGALDGQQKYAARAWVDKTYGADGIKARAAEYATNIVRAKNAEAFPDGNFEITPGTLASEMDNLSQGGLARGDMDALDWARDEIFAETFAKASETMDFNAIRRGAPTGSNFLTFAEGILGAQARALTASGVRIDPQTGAPLEKPADLFAKNPLLATDKKLVNQLGTYINNYRQWANNPAHEKPAGVRIAPSGRASDIANNPQVTFYDRGDGIKANAFAIQDPVTGQAILRDQKELNAEHAKVREQLRALGGSKLRPENDPYLGPRKDKDSNRTRVRGKLLPPQFDFLNGFMPHIRNFARQFEQFGQTGESMQVRYHAIGSGDTGAFRIKNLGNLEAITREVIPFEWQLTKAGNLNAVLLDLTQFRNRAMRAINNRNEAMAPFNFEIGQLETDLRQWMDNHRNNLPGENKIGTDKRDAINALVGLATTQNRAKNPLNGAFGPGSAIKQFRLDRVDAAIGTGRQGFHFDYDKANGNRLPEVATPLPDLSRDLPPAKGQAMPERIAATAVIDKDGKILSSPLKTHAQLMEESLFNLDKGEFPPTKNFGFVTTEGRFVLQSEAQQIAQQSRQVQSNQPISGEIVSGLEREGLLNPVIDPLDKPVAELNKIMREVGDKMDAGLKLQSYEIRDDLPEFQTQAIDDPVDFANYVESYLAPQFPKEFQDRIKSAAKTITTPQGQAMPDLVAGRAKDMPMSALKVLHADSSTLPKPDKKTTNAKVALQLADAAEKHYGGKVTSSNITPEIESDLIIVGSDEAEAALKASGKNAANWYSTAIQAALAVAGTIHRSLSDLNVAKQNKFFAKENDPVKAAQFALRIPLAITSQNMTVPLNARYANEQFDIFSKTGKFDPSKSYGEKAKSISGNLQLANDMIDAFGGITALEAFVSKEFTVRDLEAVASKAAGRKVTIAGRKEDIVNGAAIFGPKIGQGFLQNLMGNFDPVTIDLWMRRTWGRWTGDVVGDGVTATRLGRIIQEYRSSGRKLPDLIKRLRTVERSTGVTSTGKPKKPELTVSEDVEARIDNDPAFRKEIEAFAKEANAEFQGYYKLISQPMSIDEVKRINKAFQDAQANQDKADSIIQNAFTTTVRRQQSIKAMLDQKWDRMSPEQKKKLNQENPQKAIAKDAWVAMQHAAQKRTEVLSNEIKNALKPNWANAAKSIVSELNPIDIPSDLDRRVISRVVNGIREEMGRRGYSLTNADVQAILWYPEKDLWAKLRGEEESGLKQSYDDEFIKIAEDLGLGSEAREVANRIRGY